MPEPPKPLFPRVQPRERVRVEPRVTLPIQEHVLLADVDGVLYRWLAPFDGLLKDIALFVDAELPAPVGIQCQLDSAKGHRELWPLLAKSGLTAFEEEIPVAKGDRVTLSLQDPSQRELFRSVWIAAVLEKARG